MTQQEIYQNMTKGEWSTVYQHGQDRYEIYSDSSRCIPAKIERNQPLSKNSEQDANALAIPIAVNNTYGKGINPESVEKMKNVLTQLVDNGTMMRMFPSVVKEIKEALAASKL